MIEILPIKQKNVCLKCLKKTEKEHLHKIEIEELGFGSMFEGMSTHFHLCDECYDELDKDVWGMHVKKVFASEHGYDLLENDDYPIFEEYIYEDEMIRYIENLPIQSQEVILNQNAEGWKAKPKLESQAWINQKMLELEKKKEKMVIPF